MRSTYTYIQRYMHTQKSIKAQAIMYKQAMNMLNNAQIKHCEKNSKSTIEFI